VKWLPSQLGAEPKKVALLGAVLVVAAVAYWMNRSPSLPDSPTVAAKTPLDPPALKRLADQDNTPPPAKRTTRAGGEAGRVEDFRPSLKPKEGVDLTRIDPTIRLDLLAKVHGVPMEGGSRSLFEFSQPPAPPPPKVDPIKVPPPAVQPPAPAVTKAVDAPKPPLPPIPLKYYGFAGTNRDGTRRGCFLDGDAAAGGEVYIAAENETVKSRYKIVSFGVNSVVVEDTANKNQQTLPLIEEVQ
jgi:hypothetical protein